MEDRKSFLLHKDTLCVLEELTDEQAGVFIKAIFQYQTTGVLPELDLILRVAVKPFILQFERDNVAYQERCEVNKINGEKGGRPKKTEKTQSVIEKPNKTQQNRTKPKKADNDSDKDNDSDTITDKSEQLRLDCLDFYNKNKDKYPHYTPEFFKEFIGYWGEKIVHGKGKGKCLYEIEKTWNLSRRLKTSYDVIWKPKQANIPVGNSQHLITF